MSNQGTQMVKYGTYETDAAATEAEQLEQTAGGDFFKLSSGDNVVRFLPPPMGKRSPFLLTYQHYVQLPGMEKGAGYNCPRMMGKKPCPLCQKIDELRGSGNKAEDEIAGQMFPKVRVYANIIARSQEEAGPQVIAFGKKIHEGLIAIRQNEDAGGDFTDPVNGFDITINKVGEKLKTVYKVLASRNNSPLGDVTWIEQQADLDRFGKVSTFDEIADDFREATAGVFSGGAQRGRGRGAAPAPAYAGRTQGGRTAPATPAAPAAGRTRGRTADDDMTNVVDEEKT